MITTNADLVPIIARLRADGLAALDTEFVWTSTFFPRLGIVQLGAADGTAWVVDACAAGAALAELIADPQTVKILHDARQDLTLLARATGALPRNVFDTQLAAGFAGLAATVSLKQILHDMLNIDLPKTETRTDWCRRPLSDAQVEYAKDDVRSLAALRQALIARAAERGADAWLAEEMTIYDEPGLYAPPVPEEAWRRIKGGEHLSALEQTILRAIATLRERRAMEWDMPRNWVVDDGSLTEIAIRKPASPEHLHPQHRLRRDDAHALWREIIVTVQAVCQDSAGVPPSPEPKVRSDGAVKKRIDDALEFLRKRADELRIAPTLLGTRAQVSAFVAIPDDSAVPLSRGWRYETAGRDLANRLAPEQDLFGVKR